MRPLVSSVVFLKATSIASFTLSIFSAAFTTKGVTQLADIGSIHVATYIEQLQRARSAPTAKLRLAALRHLFDWMVVGQIMPTNPAAAVRGPRHIVRRGKTPVLVKDIAQVVIGAAPRLGQFGIDTVNDAVEGVILLRVGEQAQTVLKQVEAKTRELNDSILPKDVKVRPFYDRSDLVALTTSTV